MADAVFKFRASGDVDVSSLTVDYGNVAPSEDWCHLPPIVKKVDDPSDNLYELHFPLSIFNVLENGSAVRTCTVTGPIYVAPKYNTPIINVNLTIRETACLDKLNCEDLLNAIDVYANIDNSFVSSDGGLIEIQRDGVEPFFDETMVGIFEEDGVTPCSWASFDNDGNVLVNRRGFDELGTAQRVAIIRYHYDYTFDTEIDDNTCNGDFEGSLMQNARSCDEADVSIEELNTEFDKEGGWRPLEDIFYLAGEDAGTFTLNSVNDVTWSGDAFGSVNPVSYDEEVGYYLTVASNEDQGTNMLEDKIGNLCLTYHNIYLPSCTREECITIVVHGLTCEELLENVYISIKLDDERELNESRNISINHKEHRFSIYITGNGYADYFDINEDECVIPTAVTIAEGSFIIPANPNRKSGRTYTFTFVAEILDEEYSEYSVFGCKFERQITFSQGPYQDIQQIGEINESYEKKCESIEQIPSESIEQEQQCEYVKPVTNIEFTSEQSCTIISPVHMYGEFGTNCSSIEIIDDSESGLDSPTIDGPCE